MILAFGMLKRRLGSEFDRIHEHADTHAVLRRLLRCVAYGPIQNSRESILGNVSLLYTDMLPAIEEWPVLTK